MSRKLAIMAAILSLNICAFAQIGLQQRNRTDTSIRGKLIAPGGQDAGERIEVRLEKDSSQIVQTTYTDASGSFEFRSVPAGSYVIAVNAEGYEPLRQQIDNLSAFGGSAVTVFLTKTTGDGSSRVNGLDAEDPDVIDVTQMKENLPKKAVQDYEKALDERKKGKLESAIKLLEDAIHLAPNFYNAHNSLGILYQSLKRYAEAEKEYLRSRELNARSAKPLTNLGSLYIEQADLQKANAEATGKTLDQALDSLEAAVKLNPRSAQAYYLLGLANYKSAFLEEAEAAFKKAHNLDSSLTRVNLLLANIHWQQGKWNEVLENIDAYLKENPKAADRPAIEEMRAKVLKEHSD